MKLALFTRDGSEAVPGVLTERGVVPIDGPNGPRALLEVLQNGLQPHSAAALPLNAVKLLPPVPRPGKILCSTATFDGKSAERPQLLFTLKSAESVIGPDQTVRLPDVGSEWQFVPEAELGIIVRGPARGLSADDWQRAVYGYTCVIDVMAQGDTQFGRDFWLAKSDTLGPIGPCIVTPDEVPDVSKLRVRSFVNGQPGQDYSLADAEFSLGEQLELATTIMTLYTGDLVACGTSRRGLRSISDGDTLDVDIEGVGRLQVRVAAPSGVGV